MRGSGEQKETETYGYDEFHDVAIGYKAGRQEGKEQRAESKEQKS